MAHNRCGAKVQPQCWLNLRCLVATTSRLSTACQFLIMGWIRLTMSCCFCEPRVARLRVRASWDCHGGTVCLCVTSAQLGLSHFSRSAVAVVVCVLVAGYVATKAANFPAGINLVPVGNGKQMTPAVLKFLKTLGKHGIDLPSPPTQFAMGPQWVGACR